MKLGFIISLLLFRLLFTKIEYDLVDGIEETITDVNTNLEYSFYIKASKPNFAKFTFSVPIPSKIYLSVFWIYIFEYTKRNSITPNKNYWAFFYSKEINNKLLASYLYNISSSLSNYVEFKLSPSLNYSYMNVRIDIIYKEYDLDYNKPLNIYNLSSNNAYYLYLELFETKIAKISLIINNMRKEPFSGIYIHELETRRDAPSIDITYQPISFTSNFAQLTASFSYSVKFSNKTNYIALNITPSLNIDQIIILYEIQ